MVPKVMETPSYIELASSDALLSFAYYEDPYMEITVNYDDSTGDTIEETVVFRKDDVIRFLDKVIKKFDG